MCIYLAIHLSVCFPVYLSLWLPACPPVHFHICLLVFLSTFPPVYLGSPTSTLAFNPLEDSRFRGGRIRDLMKYLNLKLSKVVAVGTPQSDFLTTLLTTKDQMQCMQMVRNQEIVWSLQHPCSSHNDQTS